MATTMTKSSQIREYIEKHPEQKPAEIIAGLKKTGVSVSMALVSKIAYDRPKKNRKQAKRVNGHSRMGNNGHDLEIIATPAQLREAKRMLDAYSGILN